MSVALEAIEGIDSALVSLNEGVATITFAAEHQVTVAEVRQVIRDNGFSPKGAEVRLLGRVNDSPDGMTFALPGQNSVYGLREHADATGVLRRLRNAELDRNFVIEGVVPERESGDTAAPFILLRRFFD